MSIKFKQYLLPTLLLILVACGTTHSPTYGPINEDVFQDVFLTSIGDQQQQILFYSRAIWYPNKNGFKFLPAGKKSHKGIIVCTDQGVYFTEWNTSGSYSTEFLAKYDQIEMLRHAANNLFGRVVIKKDHFNSFEILGIDGADLPNKEQTEIAYKIIQQQAES